jgi:hypothetical protein
MPDMGGSHRRNLVTNKVFSDLFTHFLGRPSTTFVLELEPKTRAICP